MEFVIVKRARLKIRSGKRRMIEGTELPNQKNKKINKNRTLGEKSTYEYLGILEVDTFKQMMKEKKISGE